jgi:hypothetical protein
MPHTIDDLYSYKFRIVTLARKQLTLVRNPRLDGYSPSRIRGFGKLARRTIRPRRIGMPPGMTS